MKTEYETDANGNVWLLLPHATIDDSVETMHAALLVRNWRRRLESFGVDMIINTACTDFQKQGDRWELFSGERSIGAFDAVIFALGGGSYETSALDWPAMFTRHGIGFQPFTAANTGFEVAWPAAFLQEAEGQPIKNIELTSQRGRRKGDLVITRYGLEGTPIYFAGQTGTIHLDLKPDLTQDQIVQKLEKIRENLSPMRRAQKFLPLSVGAKALLFHLAPADQIQDLPSLARLLKAFPIRLERPRPLSESISSAGGVLWDALDANLMLKSHPGVYCAGEMIDWDAPTGGFLIQACVAEGHWVSRALLAR